ncbi:protein RADIALIS-like 3 [Malania oleifera]|uniref:protein RADIALIS-like 3 n=1 Tax=Malania oleifera TaxID=397392 RepID=UPI0025AEBDA8|nr:protein RADIALIS-like 3 [Malania oleifera]
MKRDYQSVVGESAPTRPSWTRSENEVFEEGLVQFPEGTPDRWEKIAGLLSEKSPAEVQEHYEALVFDVDEIKPGRTEIPHYANDPSASKDSGSSQTCLFTRGLGSKSKSKLKWKPKRSPLGSTIDSSEAPPPSTSGSPADQPSPSPELQPSTP